MEQQQGGLNQMWQQWWSWWYYVVNQQNLPSPSLSSSSSSFSSSSSSSDEMEPFWVPIFYKNYKHHSQAQFAKAGNAELPRGPMFFNVKMDTDLGAITQTIRQVMHPDALLWENTVLSFAVVYLDHRDHYAVQKVAMTMLKGETTLDDHLTLAEIGFEIGDFLDVAIRYAGGKRKCLVDYCHLVHIGVQERFRFSIV
ncbi:hypothetical protein PIB30_034827 [Stylosanthes scabra]|uniref:Uncharacterized protein n=1 Tax=Stylosanthes scabra TaxID=79078 RepID=A0ABU6WCS5_9FABA|nr:hypothetical protein [Stylosanthes scabra]